MSNSLPIGNTSSRQASHHPQVVTTEPTQIWLDHLPRDISIRIILYLHPASSERSTPQSTSLLSLAETTNTQRLAVVSALSHHLHVPKQADHALWSRWATVFGPDVHHLSLLTIIPQTDALLTAPNLHRASVLNLPTVLNSLTNAYRLRHLELHLIRYSNSSSQETLSALRHLKLESLSLICDIHSVEGCIFTEHSHIVTLSTICQPLQSLKVTCFCNHKVHPNWLLLHRLPHLRRIAVDGRSLHTIPDSYFALLQNMHSVALDGGDITVEAALRIGSPVTTFRSSCVVEKSKLAAMARCSRMAELQVCLTSGASSDLTRALKFFFFLNSLHLRAPTGTLDIEHGNVLRAVTSATHLRILRLTGLRVDTGELVDVLKHLGERLIEFETTVDEMDASQVGQIEALLETAAQFNTKLRKFDLVSTISAGQRPCHWPSVSRRASRIRLNYERLRLKAPGLYSWSLEKYIHLLEHDALHEVQFTG